MELRGFYIKFLPMSQVASQTITIGETSLHEPAVKVIFRDDPEIVVYYDQMDRKQLGKLIQMLQLAADFAEHGPEWKGDDS